MNLIGINGFKTSGKDTAFGFVKELAEADSESAVRLAFADKLKVLGSLALGFEGEDGDLGENDVAHHVHHMDDFKETGKIALTWRWFATGWINGEQESTYELDGRQYLQNLGAQARRVFGDSFWVDQVLPDPQHGSKLLSIAREQLAGKTNNADWICVTDVRYPNEAQRVLDLDGEVWEIVRPGVESDGHSSETPLPTELVTVSIANNSTLDALRSVIADTMGTFGSGPA